MSETIAEGQTWNLNFRQSKPNVTNMQKHFYCIILINHVFIHYPLCNSVTRVYSITWISVGDMEPRYEDLVHGAEHRAREVIERSI